MFDIGRECSVTSRRTKLGRYGLPQPNKSATTFGNREYLRETSYDTGALTEEVSSNVGLIPNEQLNVYQQIIHNIKRGIGKICFMDVSGGIGKTFLINFAIAKSKE